MFLMELTGIFEENHQPGTSHLKALSDEVIIMDDNRTHNCIDISKPSYHIIVTTTAHLVLQKKMPIL